MDGFGCHTFMLHKGDKVTAVNFRWKSVQGIQNLTPDEAAVISGTDPDANIRDLRTAIQQENASPAGRSIPLPFGRSPRPKGRGLKGTSARRGEAWSGLTLQGFDAPNGNY